MENPISITLLNDFIFCPASIFFHSLDYDTDRLIYQNSYQINGTTAHEKIDNGDYSSKKSILQGVSVYCDKYNLIGKIDMFDIETGILTEKKNKINNIYDGYVFQLYGQYFALIEDGYVVNELRLYSMSDNKIYKIDKPEKNREMKEKFEQTIEQINQFNMETFLQTNEDKCKKCIYEPLCSYSFEK